MNLYSDKYIASDEVKNEINSESALFDIKAEWESDKHIKLCPKHSLEVQAHI